MKYLSRKPLSAITLGAIVLPVIGAGFGATSAQARPKDSAPAYGYRKDKDKNRDYDKDGTHNRDDRDRDNDGIRNRDDDDNRSIQTIGNRVTYGGVVTKDGRSENRFQLRADDNLIYRIITKNREPRRLSEGDRIRVSGFVIKNQTRAFLADSVTVVQDENNGNNGNWNNGNNNEENFTGTVTGKINVNRLLVRRDSSTQTYIVQTDTYTARNTQVGDRIRVRGRLVSKGTVQASNIDRLNDNDSDNYYNGNSVRFNATVVRVISNRQVQVRDNNNRTYIVNLDRNRDSRINAGDGVYVSGRVSNNTILNATMTLTRNVNNGGNYGNGYPGNAQRVNFTATVLGYRNGLLDVRGDNGQTYRVRWVDVKVGGHIRIEGVFVNGIVEADNVNYA